MTLTISQLREVDPVFTKLINVELPIAVSYRLNQTAQTIALALLTYDQDRRRLIETYGEIGDQGTVTVPDQNVAALNSQLAELENQQIQLPDQQFTLAELSGVRLTTLEVNKFQRWIAPEPATSATVETK
jgi:hypothetical protein